MRQILKRITYIFLLTTIFSIYGCKKAKKNKGSLKPNILYIVSDDLRPALGAYGNKEIHSPNIDRLASQSVVFKKAFAQHPSCWPSRISFLTGIRLNLNSNKYFKRTNELNRSFISMPKYFTEHGYYTASLGKVFHHMHDRAQDWSETPWRSEEIYYGKEDWAHYNTYHEWQDKQSANYVNPKTGRGPYYEHADVPDTAYQDGKLAKKAIVKLKEFKKSKQPFFLAVGFWRPHLPLNAPQKYWDMYKNSPLTLAENRFSPYNLPEEVTNSREILQYGRTDGWPDAEHFQKTTLHAYYACVSYVDRQIGKLLDTLEKLHLSENTIVVLMGDHGWHLGDHNFWAKANIMYKALHAPLIIKAPGYSAKSVSEIVEYLDIYPTLVDLAGVEQSTSASLDGKSLLPLINEKKTVNNDWVNAAYQQWFGARNIITPRYSYTEWDNSESRMLFDHQIDPEENMNVVDKPEYQKVVKKLSNRLHNKFPGVFKKR